MSTATVQQPLSYEEERGKPMPSRNHSAVQSNLILEFGKHREFRIHSELSLQIGAQSYTPDLSVFPRQPLDLRHDAVREDKPPLLVVEISSPRQGVQEVMDKVDAYFRHGIKSCWIVVPPLRSVRILTADGHEESVNIGIAKDPVTGLTADLDAVFS